MLSLPMQTAAKLNDHDEGLLHPKPNATNSYFEGLVLRYNVHSSNLCKNSVQKVFLDNFYTANDRS